VLQAWEFKLLCLGFFKSEVGAHAAPLGKPATKWQWDAAGKFWTPTQTKIAAVDNFALLDPLISPAWWYTRFHHASTTEKDGTSICDRCAVVYEWHKGTLKLQAYFKKTNAEGVWIKT